MGGSKSEEFLAQQPGRRGHLRALHEVRLRRQRRGRAGARRPRPSPYDDAPAAHAEDTPDTPTIETLVDHLNAKFPRDDRALDAGDTLKNVLVVLKHADGTPRAARHRAARRPRGRPEAARGRCWSRPRSRRSTRRTSRSTRRWSRATSGPARWGEKSESGIRYLVDPRVVEGTRWVTGANVHGSHVLDLVAGRDFTRRRHHRGRRGPRRRPLPQLRRRHPGDRARHRDGPHLPARSQVRRRARPQGARRERQARHGHDGLLRHRRLARRRR